ncbi:hypothetical protein [Myroides odoratus]|uniref:Uncharacterized protein n=1 Tax=Myroides odoratus TaxID=256 RepID=A0A378RLH8_MYROD|nr:hypothetical protein [Myroides odoratus]QQU04658.1 hypothetical protein I6I89_05045 [Myroides odoratus]STZ27903.1 Uncharacterised protein [Myroides odoratus]
MKKNSILFCIVLLFMVGCSTDEEQGRPDQDQKLSEEAYRKKVSDMEAILYKYGGVDDVENPYDYNNPENRKEIEKLDLRELEQFFQEFSSEEGLKNLDQDLSIDKSKQYAREHNPQGAIGYTTRAESSYSVTGSHSSAIIGSSRSLVNFKIRDNERITFTSANATYSNNSVEFEQVNGHHIIPFTPNANQDYYDHKGGINVDCTVKAYNKKYVAVMYARFNRKGEGSVESFRI